jgi:hypothetical protein
MEAPKSELCLRQVQCGRDAEGSKQTQLKAVI